MLKLAQTENKRNKILNAFKKGNVEMVQEPNKDVEGDKQVTHQQEDLKTDENTDKKPNNEH